MAARYTVARIEDTDEYEIWCHETISVSCRVTIVQTNIKGRNKAREAKRIWQQRELDKHAEH